MLKNRKKRIYIDTSLYDKYKLRFHLYIERKYHYCGGNYGEHLRYYRYFYPQKTTPKYPEHEYCFICGWNLQRCKKPNYPFLWEPSEIFYIFEICKYRDNDNIKIIGKCCLNRFINVNNVNNVNNSTYKLKTE